VGTRTNRRYVALAAALLAGSVATAIAFPTADVGSAPAANQRGVVGDRPDDGTVQFLDGEVRAIAEVGNSIVVGGNFTKVGPGIRGAIGRVDLGVGEFSADQVDVDGAIYTVVEDGGGGRFIAGDFMFVGGQPRTHLAHLLPDGSLDTAFAPQINGPVRALVVANGNLYIGGQFSTVNGVVAGNLAAITPAGVVLWTSTINGVVNALETNGTLLYVAGDFSSMNGNSTIRRLGAINLADGLTATSFAPGFVNLAVSDLQLSGTSLWLVGDFTKVNNIARNRIASVDSTTGALGAFAAAANGRVNSIALDSGGTTAYIGGAFTTIGATAVSSFAGVSTTTGLVTTPVVQMTGPVYSVLLDGQGNAYVGGSMAIYPEKPNPRTLAKIALSTGVVTKVISDAGLPLSLAHTPKDGGGIRAMTLIGSSLFVAGDFSDYGIVERPYLAAYDKATKALRLDFAPVVNDMVRALDNAPDGSAVYVGGDFTTLNGTPVGRIAKLSMTNGQPVPSFTANFDAYVKEIVAHPDNQRVFVGGNFRFTNGINTERFAGVSASSGAVIPGYQIDLTEPTNDSSEGGVRAMALNAAGNRLAIVGNFRQVEGNVRPLVALLDVSNAAAASVTGWTTSTYDRPCAGGRAGWMRDVTFSPDGARLFVVTSGHFYYPACDVLNAFDATAGGITSPQWTARPGDTIESVAATNDAVYIGGHFRVLDWEHQVDARFQLGAYEPTTGKPLSWDPTANGFRGVLVLEAEPSGLYMGSDGTAAGGVAHGRTARWGWPSSPVWLRRSISRHLMLAAGDSTQVTLTVTNTTASAYTITGLSDSISGNVVGQGTCTAATVAAGATYSCTFTQTVPALAAGTVTKVSTSVVGTLNGQSQPLFDRTSIRSIAAYLDPIVRSVVGPVTVPFPSGPTTFAVTIMNESELAPLTINTLTSSVHGLLNGQGSCATPQTVAPYSMYTCVYVGTMGGPIGSSVANRITADLVQNGVASSKGHSTSVLISRPLDGGQALMVVGSINPLASADLKVRDRITSLGFTPVLVDDDLVTTADTGGKAFGFIASSVSQVTLGTKLTASPLPLIVGDRLFYDEFGMTTAAGQGAESLTSVDITRPDHSLAGSLLGVQAIYSSARPVTWGEPAATAEVIATVPTAGGAKPSIFVYQPTDVMASGVAAPGCRTGLPAERTSLAKWGIPMFALFDRAVRWSAYGCGTNIIATAAGNGTTVAGPNGANAIQSGLQDPFGIAVDAQGGFYVAEYLGHRVRYVSPAGVVTTVAGTGTAGFSGEGQSAVTAQLRNPTRVRLDPQGRLVIVDSANHRIRRVEINGTLVTIAGSGTAGSTGDGGSALTARLNSPQDVAFAADGTMYIADRNNHKIRKVTPAGVMSTFAGSGTAGYNGDEITATTARLANPYGVAVTPEGVLIADFDNNRVRSVDPAGMIHTVAGTGNATAGGDGGPANLADVHKPVCVAPRPGGGFLICDYNNNRVRAVADGIISTIVGVGTAGYSGDGDLALYAKGNRFSAIGIDAAGNLFVVDRFNARVRKITDVF
jgi:Domain of unknown function (DUF5122) beta-propeller/NHL repeat